MAAREEVVKFIYDVTGDKELAATAATMLKVAENSDTASAEVLQFSASLKAAATQAATIQKALSQKAGLADLTTQLTAAQAGLNKLRSEFNQTDTSSKKVAKAFADAEKAVASLTSQQRAVSVELQKTVGSLQKAGVDTTNLAAAYQKVTAEGAAAATALGKIGNESASAAKGTKAAADSTSRLGTALAGARDNLNSFVSGLLRVTGIAGAVSAALSAISVGRIFGGAVTSAKDFEAALSEVQAVSGATAAELKLMRDAAEAASRTTKFSATEAAGALGELARASGNASDAVAELPATLNLAQAAGIGASEAATILTTALTQFGAAAGDATRFADIFAREANSTNDTVTGLGLSLSYVAPLAKQLGLTVEETAATLGALAEQGFRGERAGTALRNVFSELLTPTSAFRSALSGLGIEGNDFGEIITKLAAAGDRGKQALLTLDAQARPAIAALVASGGAGIRRLTEDFKNAAGEAERTSRTMGQNFEGAAARLTNAFDAIRRAVIDPVLAPLSKQFDEASAKVRSFAQSIAFDRIKNAIADFATSATASIINFVSNINPDAVAKSLESFATSAKQFFNEVKDSASTVGTALKIVFGTVSTLFNGLQTAILGSAAVITGAFAAILKVAVTSAEGLSRINGSFIQLQPTFDAIKEKIGGLVAVSNEFAERAAANATETKNAFNDVSAALDGTKASAEGAAKAQASLADQVSLTAEQAVILAERFLDLPPSLQKIVEPGLRAAGVFSKIAEAAPVAGKGLETAATALDKAKTAATAAYNDLARLAGAGQTTGKAFEDAQRKVAQTNAEFAKLAGISEEAAAEATALSAAQARLGKTHEQLAATAKQASADTDLLFKSYLAGTSVIDDVRAAFENEAQALRASVANGQKWEKDRVESDLRVRASILGVTDSLRELSGAPLRAPDTQPIVQSFQNVEQASGEAADQLASDQQRVEEIANSVTGALGNALSAQGAFLSEFAASSENAVKRFTEATKAFFEGAGDFSFAALTDSTGIIRFGEAVEQAGKLIEGQIAQQRQSVQDAAADWTNLSDASVAALARQKGGLDNLAGSLSQMAANARSGVSEFDLLGASDLSGLSSALDSAAAKVDALKQKAIDAKAQIDSIGASLQDQIDQINNNQAAIENRRFDQQLQQLHDLAEESDTLGTREYNEAVARAKTLHELKLKQIEDEKKASGGGTGTGGGGGGTPPGSPPHAPSPPPAPAPTPTPAPTAPLPPRAGTVVNLTVNSTIFDQKTLEDVARQLKKIIDDINGRS